MRHRSLEVRRWVKAETSDRRAEGGQFQASGGQAELATRADHRAGAAERVEDGFHRAVSFRHGLRQHGDHDVGGEAGRVAVEPAEHHIRPRAGQPGVDRRRHSRAPRAEDRLLAPLPLPEGRHGRGLGRPDAVHSGRHRTGSGGVHAPRAGRTHLDEDRVTKDRPGEQTLAGAEGRDRRPERLMHPAGGRAYRGEVAGGLQLVDETGVRQLEQLLGNVPRLLGDQGQAHPAFAPTPADDLELVEHCAHAARARPRDEGVHLLDHDEYRWSALQPRAQRGAFRDLDHALEQSLEQERDGDVAGGVVGLTDIEDAEPLRDEQVVHRQVGDGSGTAPVEHVRTSKGEQLVPQG